MRGCENVSRWGGRHEGIGKSKKSQVLEDRTDKLRLRPGEFTGCSTSPTFRCARRVSRHLGRTSTPHTKQRKNASHIIWLQGLTVSHHPPPNPLYFSSFMSHASFLMPHVSSLTSHVSCLISLMSYSHLCLVSHVSSFISHLSSLTSPVLSLISHASCIVSHRMSHVSCLISHPSSLISCFPSLIPHPSSPSLTAQPRRASSSRSSRAPPLTKCVASTIADLRSASGSPDLPSPPPTPENPVGPTTPVAPGKE